jgi:hypothetical protein
MASQGKLAFIQQQLLQSVNERLLSFHGQISKKGKVERDDNTVPGALSMLYMSE